MFKYLVVVFIACSIVFAQSQDNNINLTTEEKEFLKVHNKFSVHMENNYIPFSNIGNNGKFIGYSIDFADMVADRLGIKFVYNKNENWSQSMTRLKTKKIDIIAQTINTKERQAFALFTKDYMTYHQGIIVKDKNIDLNTVEKLKGHKVGIVSGYNLENTIKKVYPTIKHIGYSDNETLLNAVLLNKVDAAISTHQVMQYNINTLFLKNITSIPILNNPNITKTTEAFAIRNDLPLLHSSLQKAFDSISQKDMSKLQLKWFGQKSNVQNDKPILSFLEKKYLANKKVIKMCNNPNWEPIEFAKDGDLNNMQGIAMDTLKLLEQKLDIKFQNVPTKSWSQSQQFLKEKKCDILPCAAKTLKRLEYANFTKPYLKLPLAIFTTKDKKIVVGLDEIIEKPWTRKKDSGVIAKIKKEYPDTKVIETKDNTVALQLVNSGEVYFTIATLPVASNVINKYQLNNLHIAGYTNIVFKLSVAVRDDDKVLLGILNKTLDDIPKDKMKQIMRKWVLKPIKEPVVDYSLIYKILFAVFIIILFLTYKQYMLRRSIKESNELINATMEAIILHKNGICVDANQSAVDMFGFKSKKELQGVDIFQHIAQESQALVRIKMANEDATQYEATLLKKDGSEFYGLVHEKFIRDRSLRLSGIFDITLLKEQEQLISEQSKMVQMGEMIGNIAHQWRQPLSVISTAASGIQISKEFNTLTDEQENEMLRGIVDNVQFLSKTIDTFRNYIKEKKELKEIILQDRINSAINLIEASLKNNHIELINNIDNVEPIKITMVVGELLQVIINIINNAKDILVEKKIENKIIKINLVKKQNKAIISIEDNGDGIPNDVLPKIFDPYFTTKHKSQGTGLGLHMSKEIIEKHLDGRLYATNSKNGAIFTMELPLDKN